VPYAVQSDNRSELKYELRPSTDVPDRKQFINLTESSYTKILARAQERWSVTSSSYLEQTIQKVKVKVKQSHYRP
jgi:hypothetical protein